METQTTSNDFVGVLTPPTHIVYTVLSMLASLCLLSYDLKCMRYILRHRTWPHMDGEQTLHHTLGLHKKLWCIPRKARGRTSDAYG